jgi:hypothetical protein
LLSAARFWPHPTSTCCMLASHPHSALHSHTRATWANPSLPGWNLAKRLGWYLFGGPATTRQAVWGRLNLAWAALIRRVVPKNGDKACCTKSRGTSIIPPCGCGPTKTSALPQRCPPVCLSTLGASCHAPHELPPSHPFLCLISGRFEAIYSPLRAPLDRQVAVLSRFILAG